MSKLPTIKTRELLRVLLRIGFFKHHQIGSHAQFKHKDGRRITVSIHSGHDVPNGTLRGIIHDIKISVDDFIRVLNKE